VAVGDNATASNTQTLSKLLGKMLRLNADGTIPTNNPFFNQATGVNRAIRQPDAHDHDPVIEHHVHRAVPKAQQP